MEPSRDAQNHPIVDSKEPTLKCEKYQFETKYISLLNEHMQEKHRIYRCELCNCTSSSEKGLKIHNTKSHTQYDKCDYRTYTKHIKIVTVHQLYHYDSIWGVQEAYEMNKWECEDWATSRLERGSGGGGMFLER